MFILSFSLKVTTVPVCFLFNVKVMCVELLKFRHTDKQWWDKWNNRTINGIHFGPVDSKGEESQR